MVGRLSAASLGEHPAAAAWSGLTDLISRAACRSLALPRMCGAWCAVAAVAVGLSSHAIAVAAGPVDAADVSFTARGQGAGLRNVSAALGDSVSVLDFGALGSCRCAALRRPLLESCCPDDDTAAFQAALIASSSVLVPPGAYRIDGTVLIGTAELTLAGGAEMVKTRKMPFFTSILGPVIKSRQSSGGYTVIIILTPLPPQCLRGSCART